MRTESITIAVVTTILASMGCDGSRIPSPVTGSPSTIGSGSTANSTGAVDGPIHFTRVTGCGIDFVHRTGNSPDRPFPAANGSGIGALDYDLDGKYDLYFVTGRTFPLDQPDPNGKGNQLYRNRGGWKFQNVSDQTRVAHSGYGAGIAIGDFDGDGFPDLYVTCYGPNALYHNCGDGTFREVGEIAKVDDRRWGTSAAFLDYDGDGSLDLYVCNYAVWTPETNPYCGNRETQTRIFCNPNSVQADAHILFHNEGDGTFSDASHMAGIDSGRGRGQGVVAGDFNLDGRIDLFVGNDLQPNFLFKNIGGGQFQNVSEESGAAYDKMGVAHAGMGVDLADLNGDGLPDLFVTNFEQEYNTCYLNLGNETFQDVSEINGLAAASRPWVGWGTALVDLDSDGMKDVIVTNGHTDENMSEMGRDSQFHQPPLIWRNQGKRFSLVEHAGDYFMGRYPGRGLCVVDLDNDNDPDVVVGHQDLAPALLQNDSRIEPAAQKKSIVLRLVGRNCCRDAIGTLVRTEAAGKSTYDQVRGGGSYLSAHDQRVVVTTESSARATMTIRWPSGTESTMNELQQGSRLIVIEPLRPDQPPMVIRMFSGDADD